MIEDATCAKLPDESIGRDACNVIDAKPKEPIYAKDVSWMRKSDDVPLRTQFFGDDGKLAKTLFTKKIHIDDVTFKTDIPDSFFTVAALEGT